MPKPKFYVVWKGRKTGVFTTWKDCSDQVTGFEGAEYKSFESRSEAEAAFKDSYENYKGKKTVYSSSRMKFRPGKPIADSYSVDASCIGNPGLMEYRGVHTTTRKEFFHQGPFEDGTNNIGEFLAIVHALALFKKKKWDFPIYTDSTNALSWVKHKKCKTKLARNAKNAPIFDLIARAEAWLRENEYTNPLLKWDTEAWGEIPADFGRK